MGERLGLDVHVGRVAEQRPDVVPEQVDIRQGDVFPERVLPGRPDRGPHLLDRERVGRDTGDLGAQVCDHPLDVSQPVIGRPLVVQEPLEQLEAGVKERDQHRQALGNDLLGRLAKVVLPKVDDQELFLVPVGQPFGVVTGGVGTGAPADHLLQLDLGLNRPHKDQVDRLRHVDAGL